MTLTDAERAEFIRLTKDSYDPELWLEDDLPFLLRVEKEREEAERQAQEASATETLIASHDDAAIADTFESDS
jgi:hypothetical protein